VSLYETTILRQLAGINLDRISDKTTILNFRRLLEKHDLVAGILGVINCYLGDRGLMLRQRTIIDATIIHAPSSTKNKERKCDPEMHSTKKGNQYYFGMKTHIGVDAESELAQRPMLRTLRRSISRWMTRKHMCAAMRAIPVRKSVPNMKAGK
jgi:IS5 family transposase